MTDAAPPPCPSDAHLGDYAAGRMGMERAAEVATHLETCDRCCLAVERHIAESTTSLVATGSATDPPDVAGAAPPTSTGRTPSVAPPAQPASDRDESPKPSAIPASHTPGAKSDRPPPAAARIGEYEIVRKLSQGGQGVVYLAKHRPTRRQVALKVLPRGLAADENYLRRFRREAQAAASLNHANIVTVFESGMAGGFHYIAMEFVDGQPLNKLLEARVPLYESRIVEIALAVARALEHAHAKGVLHRDIKPGNILITGSAAGGRSTNTAGENSAGVNPGGNNTGANPPDRAGEGGVKLTDFGLARWEDDPQSFLTTEGNVLGTPAFISPEQAHGSRDVDHRSDLYSFGCVIFNMAAGRPPFVGDNAFVIMDQHRRIEPPSVRALNPQISEALDSLVYRAMSKLPERRYQSAREMIDDLEAIRRALRAPETVRGGLGQIVDAMDQIRTLAGRIRDTRDQDAAPNWRTRMTIAFLERPGFWLGVAGLALVVTGVGSLLVGIWLGTRHVP